MEYLCFLRVKKISLLKNNIVKILKFKYCQRRLRQSSFSFKSTRLPVYDKIIIGSDEVWNFKSIRDSTYFGVGVKCKEKFSYAASFGSVSENEKIEGKLIDALKEFSAISVRDDNSLNILKKNLSDKVCVKVLDPTFLYNFSVEQTQCTYDNYILVYSTGVELKMQKRIIDFAKRNKKTLIGIGYYLPWCNENIMTVDPFQWIGFFERADMIITSMFHGTIFSIKYHKEFCTIMEAYRINKIKNMLEEFGLGQRIYNEQRSLDEMFANKIDYNTVESIIGDKRKESLDYLGSILGC